MARTCKNPVYKTMCADDDDTRTGQYRNQYYISNPTPRRETRSVQYIDPEHTVVRYQNRTLDVFHTIPGGYKEYDRAEKAMIKKLKDQTANPKPAVKPKRKTAKKPSVAKRGASPAPKRRTPAKAVPAAPRARGRPRKKTAQERVARTIRDPRTGEWRYFDDNGMEISAQVYADIMSERDRWFEEQYARDARNLDISEMRSLLRDARWDEVVHHSRWKWDNKSTIREFSKYQKATLPNY
jgi:hypothetical protein